MNTRRVSNPMSGAERGLMLTLTPLSVAVLCALGLISAPAFAREYFDPSFLSGAQKDVDLSAFENKGYVAPGRYLVDVYVNQMLTETRNITFTEVDGAVVPQLTVADLANWGVDTETVPALKDKPQDMPVTSLSALIPQATSEFNASSQRLNISVPQVSMKQGFDPDMNPANWEQGIPALMSNYSINGGEGKYDSNGISTRTSNQFASFNNGLNAGPWRLRSTQSFTRTDQRMTGQGRYGDYHTSVPTQSSWRTSNTYVQRDIQALRSEMTAGEGATGGDILDSIPFRGVQIKSEDSMLPNSRLGFSPVITGTANSNAVVRVMQNGYTLYQVNVAPGPFRISDMGQMGNAGDLQVVVTEADGTRHISTVAYSSLPVMQRQGGVDYELTFGKYHAGNVTDGSREPNFGMATVVYGLPGDVTLYGGALGADNYLSGVAGTALSLGLMGALSLDATWARAQLRDPDGGNDHEEVGSSYRIRYSKSMVTTGTSVDLAAYRYSTRNYYSFGDANSQGYRLNDWSAPWSMDRQRSSWQVNLNQQLPANLGSISVGGTRTDYWSGTGTSNNLHVGYGVNVKGVSLNLNYDIDRMQDENKSWPENRQLSLSMSVPFNIFSNQSLLQNVSSNWIMTHDNEGRVTQQAGVSGSVLDNKLSYGLNQGWGNSGAQSSTSGTLNYQGSRLNSNLGYSQSSDNNNFNYGVSGGVLIHQHGITLTRSMGDGAVLVKAPGAPGVKVNGMDQTDSRGYAVLPQGSSYRKNIVSLDPSTYPDGVDITQNSKNVYPTRGAVVMADFEVRSGTQLLLELIHNGSPVPFGAIASLANSADQMATGIVGDGGRVYLTGMPPAGTVAVKWGSAPGQQCQVDYQGGEGELVVRHNVVCR
ncbi:fimbria/pilus outer membrane usher protein [Lelliottia nimipressuralis]|uniref:fimbria/pilus outer membrane usher protein n=1 Tax=Lelliottia nimipressuralis TaxID=69220 RepID=UPI00355835F6